MRKWLSNSHEVMETIPEKDCTMNVAVSVDEHTGPLPSVKTLGVC